LLGLNRHTINRYFLIFRKAIYLHQSLELNKILGGVELDESYFGAKRIRGYHGKLKRGGGTLKQPVFRIFKRDGLNGSEVINTEIVPNCKKITLQGIIKGKVDLASTITISVSPNGILQMVLRSILGTAILIKEIENGI
jgi:transposase